MAAAAANAPAAAASAACAAATLLSAAAGESVRCLGAARRSAERGDAALKGLGGIARHVIGYLRRNAAALLSRF
jgi:hypothetical protein